MSAGNAPQSRPSPNEAAAIERYRAANRYINEGLIRHDGQNISSKRTRREHMLSFLPLLGEPQRAVPAIHVAGTSGKGSVCTMVAEILAAAGIRTGLHLSPYVQVATEKLWVDGQLASAADYANLVDWIRPFAENARAPDVPMHGMASVALFLEHFRREQVRLGVVEVGVGGGDDLTNVLDTRVAAITNVGLDHIKTLGPTLADIAAHKAGILQPGCRAVIVARASDDPALVAAKQRARAVEASLRVVQPTSYRSRVDDQGAVHLDYRGTRFDIEDIELSLLGPFQAANAALAIAICEELDEPIAEQAIRVGLERARLAARLEMISTTPCRVLLDGAHNPDKLRGVRDTLARLRYRRLLLVCGVLQQKTIGEGLSVLAQKASRVFTTEPCVYGKAALPAAQLAAQLGATAETTAIADPLEAVQAALTVAERQDLLVVTGSIYLAGNIREYWYPWTEVLLARTSWGRREAA